MPAATFDFIDNHVIEQGVDSSRQFTWKNSAGTPVDLTGYSARMQLRKSKADKTVLLELSTANSKIVLGGTAGTVTVMFSKADTVGVTWTSGVYDLELTSAGMQTVRFIEGSFVLSQEVTRD